MTSRLVRTRAEFHAARAELNGRVAAVLTMGALHRGHVALIEAAHADADAVVATVFVNPAQFGPTEDLARYPRDLEADVATLERAGVDLIWAPAVMDVYPHPVTTAFDAGPLGADLEGASRPTHFAGMLLVVNKFLNLIRADVAFFGEKDYQQLTLIRAMVRDLDLPVEIVGVPTVRDDDGLALSSRNAFLSAPERADAVALPQALFLGQKAGSRGPRSVLDAAAAELAHHPSIHLEYLALRAIDLGPAPERGPARLLVAARVGKTRLIDNVAVELRP